MKIDLTPDHAVTDTACRDATGKGFSDWYAEFDAEDGLKQGRRALNQKLYASKIDPWWCTTVAVEYERAREQKKKDGLYEGYFICSTKTIGAPPEAVYAAFTDPAKLAKWYGEAAKAEAKDGGDWSTADGDSGTYLRVRPNKDLRLTFNAPGMEAPSLVDVQFQDKGKGKTGLLVNHTRLQNRADADGARNAWGEALERLKAMLES